MAVLSWVCFLVPQMLLMGWTGALGGEGSLESVEWICWGFALGQGSSQGQDTLLVCGLWL